MVIKVDNTVYVVKCPYCGKKFYGMSTFEAKRKLIEHLEHHHSK